MEVVGSARMADREVLYEQGSTGSRVNVGIRYRSNNLGFALVRWANSGGVPTASEALAGAGETRWCFCECLLTYLV